MHDVSDYTRYERTVSARTSPATNVIATIGALVKVSTGESGRSDDICRFPTRRPHRSIAGTADMEALLVKGQVKAAPVEAGAAFVLSGVSRCRGGRWSTTVGSD